MFSTWHVHGDFKDLTRRTTSEKILRDKAFNIAKNPKNDGYQCGLASMIYKFLDQKTCGGAIKNMHDINNIHGLFLGKVKKGLQLLMLFKKF